MTSLGLVGIADKGTYSAEATYNKGQFVLYDGSTWLALKDNLNGVTPAEGENWKYLARGFAAELLSLVTAIDSQGLSGSQGGQVNAQSLIDVLADKVANQLIAKSMMSNVQVNDSGKVPTSALAYAMQQSIETLNSNMNHICDGRYTRFYRFYNVDNLTFEVPLIYDSGIAIIANANQSIFAIIDVTSINVKIRQLYGSGVTSSKNGNIITLTNPNGNWWGVTQVFVN